MKRHIESTFHLNYGSSQGEKQQTILNFITIDNHKIVEEGDSGDREEINNYMLRFICGAGIPFKFENNENFLKFSQSLVKLRATKGNIPINSYIYDESTIRRSKLNNITPNYYSK